MTILLLFISLLLTGITPDAPVIVTLAAYAGPMDLTYVTDGPERIAISARSLAEDTPVDVTLAVLDGTRLLAYNDDHHTNLPDLLPADAHIARLDLPGAGTYTLRIHSFSGAQDGPVEVTLTALPALMTCATGEQAVTLAGADTFRCTLDLPDGAAVTITARDMSGTLDPVLALYGPDGARVAFNDDHGTADVALNLLDARLTGFTTPAAGVYTLAVRDFSGAAGSLALAVQISS